MGVVHLVRHGQASFGAADYDVLSDLGREQARCLGRLWRADPAWAPDAVVHVSGALRRQVDTSDEVLGQAGTPTSTQVDPRWNEFSLLWALGEVDVASLDERNTQKDFQALLGAWMAGELEAPETFEAFSKRVAQAFAAVVASSGRGSTTRVFTSGGPIALVASTLLRGGPALFKELNNVMVNGAVTTILVGPGGPRLSALNQHVHLHTPLVTYR
jgi:broad specificity phosphatase PhoE